MIIRYKFESSDVIHTYKHDGKIINMDKLIVNILKDIFGETSASCYLEPLNMEDGQVYEEGMNKILVFKRTYKDPIITKISLIKMP